ncbi:hypothetical protein [Pseudazoarcus pumilus]|uniref:Uncharacterized protein n=1 Tax=Pseudazoarcus pumilus TaxID=2067960 RepID=A0A2I6S829_9RHOO|nr:hypothetical protein [Pseudazoarcus pumilus]AUN95402.1 hypothetical protein C0099_10970 [Pseudazoarcus pumilus]
MPILPSDIQLLESERMRDTPDGGGRMTQNVIPSGQAGNVFPKVSRIDSVYGRVNLRKIYVAVRTATLEMYAGAHAIITAPPENDRISCCLFSTGSWFDQRSAARDRIESYVVAGPISRMRVYGQQLIGQRAILLYQRPEDPLPDVGEVYVLSVESGAGAGTQQYVRITAVNHELRTFTDNVGDFQRRILTLSIGSTLSQTFAGGEVSRYSTDPSPTRLRTTQVADASKYYGLQPITEAGELGDVTLRLASVYAPLVPSTQRETGISMASMMGAAQDVGDLLGQQGWEVIASGTLPRPAVVVPIEFQFHMRFAPRAGTLVLARVDGTGQPTGASETETGADADGNIAPSMQVTGAGNRVRIHGGSISYDTGTGTLLLSNGGADGTGTISFRIYAKYIPGLQVSNPAHTHQIPVTLGTRGTVYPITLNPLPAPGTVVVDFRALGRWYRMRDDGAGVLVANDPSEGTGSVDYATGACIVTLGALPDVGSAVLVSWGSPVHYQRRNGANAVAATTFDLAYTLAQRPVRRGTLEVSWVVGNATRTATDDGNGNISGTGMTGTVAYHTGVVRLKFSTPPDRASILSNDYTWRDGDEADLFGQPEDMSTAYPVSGGQFTVPGSGPYLNSGSMLLQVATLTMDVQAYIDSGGAVRVRAGRWDGSAFRERRWRWDDQQVGTFNTSTGVVTITSPLQTQREVWTQNDITGIYGWSLRSETYAIVSASAIVVERDTTAGEGSTWSPQDVADEEVAVTTLTFDLTATTADAVVPGSLLFRATGLTYIDRNGTLYTNVDPATGAGLAAGPIDYETGIAQLSYWGDGAAVNRQIDAMLTTYGEFVATEAFFRTAGSPIRPASLYVQVTAENGDLLTGTADQNGVITGDWMRGECEQTMGVVAVEFGQMVEGEWVPRNVYPGTLRYNSVILTNLPLDANILGLDPVRLPSDGRVPIYRPADVVVLHNTQRTDLDNPVLAGADYALPRTDLAVVRLEDANGDPIAQDRYAVNLETGVVTIAADWDGTGVAQPLTAVHRIEDMLLLSDVQINGQVSFDPALSRDYPVDGTYLSGALLFGDMQALVTSLFDQNTWTGVWSDTLIGSQANAQYNDIDNPVEVLNESAVTERWRINFTGSTSFQLFGENLGLIATGNTGTDLAPVNPLTGDPYFVLRSAGWGGGWATGNQLRLNTVGAAGPTWIARTILAGATLEGDQFDIEARGDVD